jgi:hypothetical protein
MGVGDSTRAFCFLTNTSYSNEQVDILPYKYKQAGGVDDG